jgi:hypothetical protein
MHKLVTITAADVKSAVLALAAGPPEPDRAGKLTMYWDFFDKVKCAVSSSLWNTLAVAVSRRAALGG